MSETTLARRLSALGIVVGLVASCGDNQSPPAGVESAGAVASAVPSPSAQKVLTPEDVQSIISNAESRGTPGTIVPGNTLQNRSNPRVPAGKVLTPWGMLDNSCVHSVPHHARVKKNGDVVLNGQKVAHYDPCVTDVPTTAHDWVEYTNADAVSYDGASNFSLLYDAFTVPTAPPDDDSQLIYLFPSLQNWPAYESALEILQPVLQYGSNGSWGGNEWTIANWYVTADATGHVTGSWHSESPFVAYTGDFIESYIYQTDQSTYGVWAMDDTLSTYVSDTFDTTGPFNTAQSSVLEVYNVSYCGDYPGSSPMAFYPEDVQQSGAVWPDQVGATPYFYGYTHSEDPDCSFAATGGYYETELSYSN